MWRRDERVISQQQQATSVAADNLSLATDSTFRQIPVIKTNRKDDADLWDGSTSHAATNLSYIDLQSNRTTCERRATTIMTRDAAFRIVNRCQSASY